MRNKRLIILFILLIVAIAFFFYDKYGNRILPIKLDADKIEEIEILSNYWDEESEKSLTFNSKDDVEIIANISELFNNSIKHQNQGVGTTLTTSVRIIYSNGNEISFRCGVGNFITVARNSKQYNYVNGELDEYIASLLQEQQKQIDKKGIDTSFYEYCYSKAESEEQKKVLDLLVEDRSFGFGEWQREALIIIGEIPKETRRITIEDVKAIVNNEMGDKRNIEYFNEISGAPDWQGGSGITSTVYFLNDRHTEIIVCSLDKIIYYKTNNNGELEQIDIEGQYKIEHPVITPEPTKIKSYLPGYNGYGIPPYEMYRLEGEKDVECIVSEIKKIHNIPECIVGIPFDDRAKELLIFKDGNLVDNWEDVLSLLQQEWQRN